MRGINKVILVGNVGRPATMRYTAEGKAVASFSIATNRVKGGEDGTSHLEVEWHRLVAFGRTGEIAGQLLDKGTPVYVEGRLVPKTWTDKSGATRYGMDIWVESLQLLGRQREDAPVAVDVDAAPAEADIPF